MTFHKSFAACVGSIQIRHLAPVRKRNPPFSDVGSLLTARCSTGRACSGVTRVIPRYRDTDPLLLSIVGSRGPTSSAASLL